MIDFCWVRCFRVCGGGAAMFTPARRKFRFQQTRSERQTSTAGRQRQQSAPPRGVSRRNELWWRSGKQTRTSCCMCSEWKEGSAALRTLAAWTGAGVGGWGGVGCQDSCSGLFSGWGELHCRQNSPLNHNQPTMAAARMAAMHRLVAQAA